MDERCEQSQHFWRVAAKGNRDLETWHDLLRIPFNKRVWDLMRFSFLSPKYSLPEKHL